MQVDCCWRGGAKHPFQLKYKYRHQENAQPPHTGKLAGPKTARKYGFTGSRKPKKTTNCSITDRLPWNHRCEHTFFRTMARSAAKSSSVFGSALDHAAQLFAHKAALSLHYLLFFNSGRSTNNKAYYFHKGSPILCPARHSVSCHLEHI